MNDTHRMDWLERNAWRLVVISALNGIYRFKIIHGEVPGQQKYSDEHPTLREAIDDGMERVL